MKTILIPTDFSTAAFSCIPALCNQYKTERLQLVFVHMFRLSDSISDLLMLSRRNKEYGYIPEDFFQQCHNIKEQFPQLDTVKIEFFYGSTLANFREFLTAHNVTHLLSPENCSFSKLNALSVEPSTLLDKTGLPIIRITQKYSPVSILSSADQRTILEVL